MGCPAFTVAPNFVAALLDRRASTSGSPNPFVQTTHSRPSPAAAMATAGLFALPALPISGALDAPTRHSRTRFAVG